MSPLRPGEGAGKAGRPILWAGVAMVSMVLLVALLAPWLAPYDPSTQLLERRLEGPSREHPLGLDELGRDILSRVIWGARVSVGVGVTVVLLAGSIGILLGSISGFAGGRIDSLLMRLTDVFLAFPGILLAIALVAVLGPALRHVILALVVIGWVGYARLARGQVLQAREHEYVLAARASGCPGRRVLGRHILPALLPVLSVQASLGMAAAILAEASLSFLGLGIQPPTPSWGAMINAGRSHLLDAPHLALFPGVAILASVMGLNFLGDSFADLWSPGRRRDPKPETAAES